MILYFYVGIFVVSARLAIVVYTIYKESRTQDIVLLYPDYIMLFGLFISIIAVINDIDIVNITYSIVV